MASKLWEKNIQVDHDVETYTVGRDREMDLYLARYDVLGSIAHITMLQTINLLTADELSQLTAALREIYAEIERLRSEPMPEGELSLVKNIMVGEMMRILDGPFGIADVTIENILCGRDHTVINENIRRIQAMTPADVQQLARKYLSREELVTVIAGDLRK